jgi:hypothetical protein
MIRTRGMTPAALVTLGMLGSGLAFAATPSLALLSYPQEPTSRFGELGKSNGQFKEPIGVAVNQSTKDVYVVDKGNNRVEIFDSEGRYLSQFDGKETPAASFAEPSGLAVDNSPGASTEDVYVIDRGHNVIDKFSAAGKYLSQLTGALEPFVEPEGVAVDTTGNVWVYLMSQQAVEFNNEGTYVPGSAFSTGHAVAPGLAVDSLDRLYVITTSKNVRRFSGPEEEGGLVDESESATGVAVDASSGNVYVDRGASLAEYGPFGEPFGQPLVTFGTSPAPLANSVGIAVNGSDGTVYASESNASKVDIFKTILLPDVSTGEASGVERTSATIVGTINPDGQPASYRVQYGEGGSLTASTSATTAGSVNGAKEVSVPLSELHANTTYSYRLVGENEAGQANYGQVRTFVTLPAVEGLKTEAASEVTGASATLNGSLAPNGFDTHYYFEYGETEAYGSTSPAFPGTDAGKGGEGCVPPGGPPCVPASATADVSGLEGNTTYHYRLLGVNEFGTTRSEEDVSFTTKAVAPTVNDHPPAIAEVTRTTALFSGTINTENSKTNYYVQYVDAARYGPGTANPYGNGGSTQGVVVAAGHGDQAIGPIRLTGLLPGTTYHCRLVATNQAGAGTTYGPDDMFETAPATPPIVATGDASEITLSRAMIAGTVNTRTLVTTYGFEVGTSTSYGPLIGLGAASAGTGEATVTASLQGLQPATTYHYRIEATSSDGTEYGADRSFTTEGFSSPIITPIAPPLLTTPAIAFPMESGATTATTLTKARKLASALKACTKKPRKQRASCQRRAHRRYGTTTRKR